MVMNNLGGILGGLGLGNAGARAPRVPERQGYRVNLDVTQGTPVGVYGTQALLAALVTGAVVGVWTRVWQRTVPAQQLIHWGFGSPAFPDNQGYMWFASVDDAVGWDLGILRLVQSNARETRKIVVAEIPDTQLHSAVNTNIATSGLINRNEMIPLPEKVEYPLVGEDSLLILEYSLITAIAAANNADFSIPITIYQ